MNAADAQPYDIIIVGAGPAGATAAYYLAHGLNGFPKKRVALLERATFPRDKFCGDAWCEPALDLLEEMGVLQKLEAQGLTQDCTSGGFISPSGESYVSASDEGAVVNEDMPRCYAIKRIICDEAIARRAAEVGAELIENAAYKESTLGSDEIWTVQCLDGRSFRGKMLIAADGAASNVARSLGVVTTAPQGVASRQYIKGGTHNFKSGGVLMYPMYVMPGYVALFRHYNDDIDLGAYLIPGGGAVLEDLLSIYQNQVLEDPMIKRILGPRAEFLERVRVASLRTGGVERSTAKQFMAVGDAAGQTDPLTGEGIHTGMIGAKLAAQTIHEMFARSDFSEQASALYHKRWMKEFGRDFPISAASGVLTYKAPFILDAANVVAQRNGDAFMANFGAVMTGVKPKSTFMHPKMAIPMGVEVGRQFFLQKVMRKFPSEEAAYLQRASEVNSRDTAFANAMLIDPTVRAEDVRPAQQDSSAYQDLFQFAGGNDNARRILVMYGSEYGFSKEVAAETCAALLEQSVDGAAPSLRYVSTADHGMIDWNETHTCLFICSTAGDGVPPVPAKPFFDFLEQEKPDLSKLRFSTLALGDRAYPNFCRAGHTLHQLLTQCGGQALLPVCEVDNEDSQAITSWRRQIAESFTESALWQGLPEEPNPDALRQRAREYFASVDAGHQQPSAENPLTAVLKSKRPLSTLVESGDNEVLHIEIDLSQCKSDTPLSWEAGDALGIIPSNCPKEVDACLSGLGATGDERVQLRKGRNAETAKTLREALTCDMDIKQLSQDLLQLFIDTREDSAASVPASDPASYLAQHELQDLLQDFPKCVEKLGAQDIVDRLRPLQPRLYSIASSMEQDSKRIALCVAVVRYELSGRTRTGLATTYLADRVSEGQAVSIYLHANPEFRLPAKGSGHSCVMIGAGTGLAPYRAFLQELSNCSSKRPHLLFLGCRYEERDFLYRDELQAWRDKDVVNLVTAFSRDQADKIYVQHRMRQQGPLLFQRMELGDHFYICGDATHMAVDVERALLEIVQENGNKSEPEAKDYLDEMRRAGRLQKDVWAV